MTVGGTWETWILLRSLHRTVTQYNSLVRYWNVTICTWLQKSVRVENPAIHIVKSKKDKKENDTCRLSHTQFRLPNLLN